jgi:hypothetical protein
MNKCTHYYYYSEKESFPLISSQMLFITLWYSSAMLVWVFYTPSSLLIDMKIAGTSGLYNDYPVKRY